MEHKNSLNQISMTPSRRIAYAGVITALSVVLLYLLQVLPTLRAAMLFVLALLPGVLAYERRFVEGLLSFVAAALLSLLLVPVSGPWLMYVGFFGWYGAVREMVVTRFGRVASWAVLAVLFNVSFFTLYLLFHTLLLQDYTPPTWLGGVPLLVYLIPAAEIGFVVFEVLFGMCRSYYVARLRKLLIGRMS